MITELPMPGRLPRRCVPSLLGIALFTVPAALYLGGFTRAYAVLMDAMGGYHTDLPFMDIQSDLAGMECYRRGIDVYVTNPCDVLGRVYNYSPIWLHAVGALNKAAFRLGRELAWWWVMTVLLAGVLVVVMRSEVVQMCCDRNGRWTAAKPPAQTR